MAEYIKFEYGSEEKFNALEEKNPSTLYFVQVMQGNKYCYALYLGDKMIANPKEIGAIPETSTDLVDFVQDSISNQKIRSWRDLKTKGVL